MQYYAIRIIPENQNLIETLDKLDIVNFEEDQNLWFVLPEKNGLAFVLNDMGYHSRFGEERRYTHSTISIQVVKD